MSEQDLAAVVVAWLRADGWDVYEEVSYAGGRPDIVAERGDLVWAIEVKAKLGLAVLEQAAHHLPHAHLVSVATPYGHPRSRVIGDWMEAKGVGQLVVMEPFYGEAGRIREVRPAVQRLATSRLHDALRPEHKRYARAGAPGGGHFTEFKATCERVADLVKVKPGVTAGEIVATYGRFHYASKAGARTGIATWAEKGKVPGVRAQRDGRTVRLYPAEATR